MRFWILAKRDDPTPTGAMKTLGSFTVRDDLGAASKMARLCLAGDRLCEMVLAEVEVVPTGNVVELEVEDGTGRES